MRGCVSNRSRGSVIVCKRVYERAREGVRG